MASGIGNDTRRNNLRFMSARDATQLALTKWERVAFGIDHATDGPTRIIAAEMYELLTNALREINERVRS